MNEEKIEILMEKLTHSDGIDIGNGDVAIPYQEIVKMYNRIKEEENDK